MSRKQVFSEVHIYNKNKIPEESSIDTHCYKRIRIMLTMGLSARKIIEKKGLNNIKLSFDGAKIQDGRGTKKLGTEAAHNLPCNILINGISTWEYVNDPMCNFNKRLIKQIFLLSASTVIVEKEVNYIDSQWEKNGLKEILIDYLYECINIKSDKNNEIKLLLAAGKKFINKCGITLEKTREKIINRKTYKDKIEMMEKIFYKYNYVIKNFDYKYTIKKFIRIYSSPEYM